MSDNDRYRLAALREERRQIHLRMDSIITAAESERRDLTSAEQRQLEAAQTEFRNLNRDIERRENLTGFSARGTGPVPYPADAGGTGAAGWLPEFRSVTHDGGALGEGITPPEIANRVFDRIAETSVVIESGVPVLPTEAAELWVPRITSDPAASWVPELTEITPSDPGGDHLLIRPKKLAALTHVSSEVWADAEPIGLRAAENTLLRALALGTDKAMLAGSGIGEEPTGMATVSGVSLVPGIGALSNLDPFAEALGRLAQENARGKAIYINPRTWAELLLLKRSATGADSNMPLIADPVAGSAAAGSIYGVPVYVTPFLPADGGDDDDESTALVADTDYLTVVRRSDLRLDVDRSALFSKDGVALRATTRLDLAVPFPKAIVKLTGIVPPA